jgi:hypothetical protein
MKQKKEMSDIEKQILDMLSTKPNNNSSKIHNITITKEEERKGKTIDETTEKWNLNSKMMDLFEAKINSDTNLKSRYAIWLISLLIINIILLNVWFLLKGLGILNFSDHTFNIFVTGGLAEQFVLVRIIVKYLFNDNLTELLKLILDRTNQGERRNNNNYKKNSRSKIEEENKK